MINRGKIFIVGIEAALEEVSLLALKRNPERGRLVHRGRKEGRDRKRRLLGWMFGKNDYKDKERSFWENKEGVPQRHCCFLCLQERVPLCWLPASCVWIACRSGLSQNCPNMLLKRTKSTCIRGWTLMAVLYSFSALIVWTLQQGA